MLIDRRELLTTKAQVVIIHSPLGFGKSVLLAADFTANESPEKLLINGTGNYISQLNELTESAELNVIYLDHFEAMKPELINPLLVQLVERQIKIIIAVRSNQVENLTFLSKLTSVEMISYQQLKLDFCQLEQLVSSKKSINASDIFQETLGWPLLVGRLLNPNQQTFALSEILYQEVFLTLESELLRGLCRLVIEDKLDLGLVPEIDRLQLQGLLTDYFSGLYLTYFAGVSLLPLVRQACLKALIKHQYPLLLTETSKIAEQYFNRQQIIPAIKLQLSIGKIEQAIGYLFDYGSLLDWLNHGVVNLSEILELFNPEDIGGSGELAWLKCVVFFKQGDITAARDLINRHWHLIDQGMDWPLLDCMVALYEGRIPDAHRLERLQQFVEKNSEMSQFASAIINNILAIVYIQQGKLVNARLLGLNAKQAYSQINGARYGLSFINIHLAHIELLSGRVTKASALLRKVKSQITQFFSKDKSIRLAWLAVKKELELETGKIGSIRSFDLLVKKVNHSEAWFDLYASVYVNAVKCALLRGQWQIVIHWLNKAKKHQQTQPMEHIDQLINMLARLTIVGYPQAQAQLSLFVSPLTACPSDDIPWRLYLLLIELKDIDGSLRLSQINSLLKQARQHDNQLLEIRLLLFKAKYAKTGKSLLRQGVALATASGMLFALHPYKNLFIHHNLSQSYCESFEKSGLLSLIDGHDMITPQVVLTGKEQQISQLVSKKFRNKEIAQTLDISEQTVKFHLKNIFKKLEVTSRKQVVVKLYSHALSTMEP